MAPSIVDGEETVAVAAGDGNQRLFFILRLSRDDALAERLHGGDVVLFDGTLRTDDEMLRQRVRSMTGKLRTTQWR